MAQDKCLRLCGGTFFILLTRAMKEHGRTSGALTSGGKRVANKAADAASISERNLLKGLVRIFHPTMTDLALPTEKSNATRFKQCFNIPSIPLKNELLKKKFDERIKHNYAEQLKRMETLVAAQIDAEGKGEWLVKALLELIDQDTYIEGDVPFYVGPGGRPLNKNALRVERHFCLEAFVLGVWHYCIMLVPDNTVGADTYYEFYPSAKDGGSGGRHPFVSSIGNNPSRLVELDSITGYLGEIPRAADQIATAPIIDGYYDSYFHSVATDISAVKTILLEETINFRDFYVSNGIRRLFFRHAEMREGRPLKMRDNNPTIESVKELGTRLIIQGTGGMGKSMLMRHFMLEGIEQYPKAGRIPVYIRLKEYTSSNYEITDFVFDAIKAYYPAVDKERVNSDIANASIVLLLDGLDEINSAYRGQFETKLNRFLAVNDRLQVILSTRQFSKDTYVNDFKIFILMPLTKEKALQLVDKLPFRPYDPSKKASFRKALDERLYNDRNVFATNPLLLTFMLMTYERFGGEETAMHTFYAEVYELLSTRHDSTKEGYDRAFKAGLRPERLRDIFAAFCAITYQNEELDFSYTEIVERFREIVSSLPEPECNINPADIVEDITSGVCMLYRDGDRYYFHHRSFQEYFCALCFSKQGEEKLTAIGEFMEHRSHKKGDVTLQMLCGIIPEKSEKFILLPFLEDLLGQDDEDGYWNFIQKAYPYFYYEWGETDGFSVNESVSYLYSYILKKYDIQEDIGGYEMPFYEELVEDEYSGVEIDGSYQILEKGGSIYYNEAGEICRVEEDDGEPEIVGYTLYVQIEDVLKKPEHFADLISTMSRIDFPMRVEYESARRIMMDMKKRAKLNPRKLIEYI
ncbi:MAG: NACHT domain-containing protein [Lachnospiraceae bacterium]|nr:NACHT domain-containing protein [Lachnospiraceae bacterium]